MKRMLVSGRLGPERTIVRVANEDGQTFVYDVPHAANLDLVLQAASRDVDPLSEQLMSRLTREPHPGLQIFPVMGANSELKNYLKDTLPTFGEFDAVRLRTELRYGLMVKDTSGPFVLDEYARRDAETTQRLFYGLQTPTRWQRIVAWLRSLLRRKK